jgi:hypothetical protein
MDSLTPAFGKFVLANILVLLHMNFFDNPVLYRFKLVPTVFFGFTI